MHRLQRPRLFDDEALHEVDSERAQRLERLLVLDLLGHDLLCLLSRSGGVASPKGWFKLANLLAGKELYRWIHVTPGPAIVTASCGATVPCPVKAGDGVKLDFLFVCAGGNPTAFKDRTALQWLRALAGRGVRIGGVSGGPVILARAGQPAKLVQPDLA